MHAFSVNALMPEPGMAAIHQLIPFSVLAVLDFVPGCLPVGDERRLKPLQICLWSWGTQERAHGVISRNRS